MKRFAFVAVVLGLSLSLSAAHSHAQGTLTGINLQRECQSAVEAYLKPPDTILSVGAAHCIGLVTGIAYGMTMWETTNTHKHLSMETVPACIPEAATSEEFVKVVLHYLDENPNQLHESEGLLVFLAFHQAYPCSAK